METTALKPTPAAHQDAVRELYLLSGDRATPAWSGQSRAIHFGLEGCEPSSFEESLIETNREMARLARIAPGQRVLDAGCGIGGSSLWLNREFGALTTGISIVPEQIAEAQEAARLSGASGVSFLVADYMTTGFHEESFDVVWNLESLCHCHDARAYFPHAYALLTDGGRIACMDVFLTDAQSADVRDMDQGGAFGRIHSLDEITVMLAQAGFVDIEIVDLRSRTLRSAERLLAQAHQLWLREQFCETLFGMDTKRGQRHAQACRACAKAVLSGALTYAYIGARRPARA